MKKNIKKILSVAMVLVTLFSIISIGASAAVLVDVKEVRVYIDAPIEGEYTDFNVWKDTLGHNYSLATPELLSFWFEYDKIITTPNEYEDVYYDVTINKSAGPESEFYNPIKVKQGKYYIFSCVVEAADGYTFAPSTEYYINNQKATPVVESEYDGIREIWFCFTPNKSISSIEISGIDYPVSGKKADIDYTLPDGANYETDPKFDSTYWFEFSEMPVNPNPDRISFYDFCFENCDECYSDGVDLIVKPDKYYVVFATVYAKDGYAFSSDVTGTINGNEAIITSYSEDNHYEKSVCYIFSPHKVHTIDKGICIDCGFKCDCNCHKTGLVKFFWSIGNLFRRLLGNRAPCVCGASH